MLLYAKYARGYRQGSVNIGGTTGFDTHDPETIDSYEIGAKTSFFGRFPGTFNVAAFYNDLQDQQIQFGYFKYQRRRYNRHCQRWCVHDLGDGSGRRDSSYGQSFS